MKEKYVITDNKKIITISENGITKDVIVYQIRSINPSINDKFPSLGGWVENEYNLSQEGECWITDGCYILGNSKIKDNTTLFGKAIVYGESIIKGNSVITGNFIISGKTIINNSYLVSSKNESAVYIDNSYIGSKDNIYITFYPNTHMIDGYCRSQQKDIIDIGINDEVKDRIFIYKTISGRYSFSFGEMYGDVKNFIKLVSTDDKTSDIYKEYEHDFHEAYRYLCFIPYYFKILIG